MTNYIREYLLEKFRHDYTISSSNTEFIIPSIFVEHDFKKHMSINLENGLWQDFKTGQTGNFIKLYSILEEVSYREAESRLTFKSFFLDEDLGFVVDKKETPATFSHLDLSDQKLLPVGLESYDSNDLLVQAAWVVLYERKLFSFDPRINFRYYVGREGRYANRVVIPFEKNGKLFYLQARAIKGDIQPKYLNPGNEEGVKSSHILYPYDEEADHLVICEGPIDAISLQLRGVNATCCIGSHISTIQADILKEFSGKIILGFDNDAAGEKGIVKFDRLRKTKRMENFFIIHPPENCKDWNEAHIKNIDLKAYVSENTKVYDDTYKMLNSLLD